jgi:7-cyano-7-deazaguanine synthase in queuosine biosynthesis
VIKSRLILCSGAETPEGSGLARGRKVIQLDTLRPESNTHLKIQNVTDAFAKALPARLVDLLEIATYVYTADCEARRERAWDDEKSAEPWSRDFHFVVPVRDLPFWQREEVGTAFTEALGFLSSDDFGFTFCRLRKDRPVNRYLELEHLDDRPFIGIERVVMFSGGLDSLSGAVETAANGGPLVLVSHRSAPQINRRQRDLFHALRERFRVPMRHIPVWVNKSGFGREATQRTRIFLFSALGAAVVSALGAGGVRFYENGVTSLNLPLAAEVLRSRATRATHPEALQRLQSFYKLVGDNPSFTIDNPFIFKTKTEVVAAIGAHEAASLIGPSCSCSRTMFQPKNQWHCGVCSQCIDRRIAILGAGMGAHDCETDYETEVFTGPRKEGYACNMAVNYVRFAREIAGLSETEVAQAYNMELARAVRLFPNVGEAARQFIEMLMRHAQVVCAVLKDQIKLHSGEFLSGSLPLSSLLAMIGQREHLGEPEEGPAEAAVTAVGVDQNVFRRDGEKWTTTFNRVTKHFSDTKGMRAIAYLLAHPGEDVSALLLARVCEGVPPVADGVHAPGEEWVEGARSDPFGETEEVLSQSEIRDLKRRAATEKEQRERALKAGDHTEATRLEKSIAAIERTLKTGLDHRGRSRRFSGAKEKARKAVTNSIRNALKRIEKEHHDLWKHLNAAIHTGGDCSYRAASELTWIT